MRRSRKRKGGPDPLGSIIELALEQLDSPPPVPLVIFRAWEPSVGQRVADRSRPVRLKKKTLTVRVDSSSWMNELQMLSPGILEQLREHLGAEIVKKLKFEIGPLPPPSVGIRSDPPAERAERHETQRPFPEHIERALEAVDDPALKGTIEETLRKTLYSQ